MTAVFSVIPATTQKLYKGQKLYLTVKVTSTTPITGTHKITLVDPTPITDTTNGFAFDTSALGIDYSAPQPLAVDSSDSLTGTATFILDVKVSATTSNLTFRLFSDTGLGIPPTQVGYANLGEQIYPIASGPSKPWMPIPAAGNLNPATGPEFTSIYSVTMLDPSTGHGVPYCVIDWHETKLGGVFRNLFTSQMLTYLKSTDTNPITDDVSNDWPLGPLARDPAPNNSPINPQFIRTVTDSTGVATLYLVANNQGCIIANVEVWASYLGAVDTGLFAVVNVDIDSITLGGIAPEPGDVNIMGDVDYDLTTASTVPVGITLEELANIGDAVFTFINGQVGDVFAWDATDNSKPYQSSFPKVLGKAGNSQADQNILQFLWVDLAEYTFNVSAANFFTGAGNPVVTPTGGPLVAPYLSVSGNIINDSVAAQPINVAVYLTPHATIAPSWTPKANDSIVVCATIVGWNSNGQLRSPGYAESALQNITAQQIEARNTTLTFDNTNFLGWSQSRAGSTMSTASIYYKVTREGISDPWVSKVFSAYVMTPNS